MKHNYFKHLFTALLLLCSTVAMAHDFETDGIYYTITDAANKTVAVSYKGDAYNSYYNEYSGSVVIPKIVYNRADGVYYGVTGIGDDAFRDCGGLTSITIPGSVTSIGDRAFDGCSALTGITIPSSVTSIGYRTFYRCSELTSVTIPSSVTSIGSYAFQGCSAITSVTIPSSVTSIGEGAFYGCSALTGITIPSSVTSIGDGIFYECSKLTSVSIPSSVTSIGNYMFDGCSALTGVTIPSSVTSIGSYAFYRCRGLTSVEIPNSVTSIGDEAFAGCSGLTNVTIGDGVTSIGKWAFDGCSALTSVTISSSVTSIGYRAFYECTALKAVINFSNLSITKGSEENGMVAYYANKVINHPDGSIEIEGEFVFRNIDNVNVLAAYFGNETNIVLPDNYKGENYVIGNTVFNGCSAITSVTIPSCVTSIENNAFDNCTSLKDLRIEDGTEALTLGYQFNKYSSSEGLFYDCPLQTLYLGRNLSYQADYLPFAGKSTLTGVTIGNCVTSIGAGVFKDCSGLTAVYISDLAAWCGIYFGNFSANPLYYAHKLYLNGNLVKNLNIPEGVTRIGYCAFYGCSAITSVTIPGSVTTIGTYAFDGCSGLTSVTIGNGVTSIGTGVFGGCSGLTSISIPGSVTSIGDRAFSGCTRIKEVHINDLAAWCGISFGPASNPCIHSAANLYLNGELATNLNIPMGVTSIGNNAFKGCSAITSVTIPSSVTSIGEGAFYGCSALTGITIPSSLTSIGETVFSDCSGLTSISIPGSVTSIGNGVFDNCTSLKDLRIEDGNEVLTLGKNSKSGKGLFYDCPLNTLYLGRNLSYQAGYLPFSGNSTLASVTIGDCVTSIGADAFKGCSGLTAVYISDLAAWCGIDFGNFDANPLSCSHNLYLNEELVTNLNIPDGVTSIKESLFEDCTSLVSVEIPGSVTNIGNRAFSDCSGLANVIISDGITSIGEGAFFNCTGLESVYIWSETPPTLGMYAFYDVPTTVTLYVPSGTKKTYSAADGWSDFANIVEMPGDFELVVTAAGYATLYLDYAVEIPDGVEVYTANAVDGDRLKMLPVEGAIPANTGVIVKADASTYTFNVVDYSVPAIESNLFRGSVENENVKLLSGQVAYVLSMVNGEVGMYRAELKDGAFLNNANKAYLLLGGNNVGVHDKEFDTSTGGQLSNGYRFDFGGITGISEVSDEVKGENGEVKTVYDLQGRKVENPSNGIYIVNGRKVYEK